MDPITATLNLATEALKFAEKIWDATPDAQKAQAAGDWATFTHNIGEVVLALQQKLAPKP